jgi:hypothetical protein
MAGVVATIDATARADAINPIAAAFLNVDMAFSNENGTNQRQGLWVNGNSQPFWRNHTEV